MSPARQIAISVAVLALAAAGWLAYERGWLATGSNEPVAPPSGQAGGGGSGAQSAAGGQGANRQNRQGGGQSAQAGRTGGGAGGAGAGGFNRGGPPPVVTAAVTTDSSGLHVNAVGTVAAARTVTIVPQVTGVVAEVAFEQGASITDGQLLVRLDDADKQVAVEQAQIALDSAARALERAQQLEKSNNVTPVALADAGTAVRKAEIDLKAAQVELAKYTIKAPFAGSVGLTDVSVGDFVTSQKAIVTLDDMSTVTVSFDVPERASGLVAVGQKVTASTEALAGQTFAGAIGAVDSRVDPVARTLRVEAALPNDAKRLKPGMALVVSVDFPGDQRPVVPSLSVQWDRDGPYVWKVVDNVVHRVGVTIIARRSGTVLVAGELAEGDEVVAEGLQRMRDGIAVAPVGATAPDSAGAGTAQTRS